MLHECRKQGLFAGTVAVTQPRPSGRAKIEALASQDGLFTLVTRGLENGERIEKREIISVFSKMLDPYGQWEEFLALAELPELQLVLSNTTEAGLAYRPEALEDNSPIASFPGKMAQFLYRRYQAFSGAADKGLIFLPCELVERNGDTLRDCVLRYASDWGFPETFCRWVEDHNRFLNSLVDRIVTGYPSEEQAEAWFAEWGYRDGMLTTCEPYHLWAIEAEPELESILPLQQAGLNVHWTPDLAPFQQRKVRILNGAHTLMTPLGLLHGVENVRQLMEHPSLGNYVRDTVQDEIIPSLPYDAEEMRLYAEAVYERYLNPFLNHRLADIAMNSISKVRSRLLPTMAYYAERGERIPDGLARGFAGLLRYYQVERAGESYVGRTLAGAPYEVRDEEDTLRIIAEAWAQGRSAQETVAELLQQSQLWGCDLSAWPGFAGALMGYWAELERVES